MNSVSAGHIIPAPTEPKGSGRSQRWSKPMTSSPWVARSTDLATAPPPPRFCVVELASFATDRSTGLAYPNKLFELVPSFFVEYAINRKYDTMKQRQRGDCSRHWEKQNLYVCTCILPQLVKVSWKPPNQRLRNGHLTGYKIAYKRKRSRKTDVRVVEVGRDQRWYDLRGLSFSSLLKSLFFFILLLFSHLDPMVKDLSWSWAQDVSKKHEQSARHSCYEITCTLADRKLSFFFGLVGWLVS